MQNWRLKFQQARLEELLPDGRVRCHLSPRNCTLREGQDGFCKVRGVRNGRLITMNYSKSVHPTQETIETEAVNHFAPGAGILSCGNIGCMMSCSYCHNWRTSQAKHVRDTDIFELTPEGAVRRNLPVISFTYNDPVVWHEWVIDTARLAHEAGIVTRPSDGLSGGGSCVRHLKRPFAVVVQGERYFRGTSASRPCTLECDQLKFVLDFCFRCTKFAF
jgi:pyruvate formate lyase activating enzyme